MLFMELKQFTKESVNKVKKYLKYIKDTDWTEIEVYYPGSDPGRRRINYEETIKQRKSEYLVQDKMALFAVNRIKTLTTRYKDFKRESVYKTFIKNAISMIDYHVERSQNYEIKIDVLEIENPDDKSTEMSFQQMVTDKYTAITDKLTSLDLSTDDNSTTFELFNGMRAPLVMHYVLVNLYPQIGRILKEKKIDFDSEPEPTIFILDENPPQWDPERHYFDQDRDTLQYYVDEWKKCRRGIVIDDTYISPWMYYHMNFFVTKYPTTFLNEMTGEEENKDVVGVPPLRDNEWFVISENYEEAKRKGQMMFIAATRRAGKSTMQASHLGHCVVDNKLELIVAGGSSKDLDVLQKNFEILQNNIHVAFRVPFIMETWNKRVEIGVRDKANKGILLSYLKIINMDGGAGSKSEVFAGITPDAVIIDEVMKLPFKSQIAGLMPAIDQPGGKRCVVFLAGTSGNDTLAKDAFEFLRNPTDNEVLDMPWDMLNKYVPEDCRTWQERPFGTFIPAQMSAKKGMNKKDSNLSEFLQRESESLSKIPIKVTDWCVAKDIVKEDREKKLKDLASYTKEVLYYPMCPSDMLLSTKINPFPVQEAVSHREYLKAKGGNGRRGYLSQKTDGTIVFELSEQPLAEYPFKGGFMDCPVVLYEDLPEETPADYLYVAGCLTPGESVLTQSGLKKVEDVRMTDKLVSKDGEYVDILTMFKHYKEESPIYTFTVGNTFRKTTFTKEHPIYVSRPDIYTTGASKGRTKSFNFDDFNFKRAEDVQEGDWIKYPNIYKKENNFYINTLWDNKEIDNPLSKKDFWYLLGLYIGDGWSNSKRGEISFAINNSEKVTLNNIERIVKQLFKRKICVIEKGPGCYTVTFTCKKLSVFLIKHFGDKCYGKYLPEWVKRIPAKLKYELLCGYVNSDGCFMNLPNGYLLTEFVSVNLKMLEDVQDILFSLGIVSSLTLLRNESERSFPNGYNSKTRKTYMLRVNQFGTVQMYDNFRKGITQKHPEILRTLKRDVKSKGVCFLSDDHEYIYFKIKKIDVKTYTGWVYNFECVTNTFLAHHITTHNCDDYKQDESGTDSIGSFHIYKLDVGLDKNCGKIVASLATRPDPHEKFHQQMYLLQQKFNAVCFMENADLSYKDFLERRRVADKWLCKALDFEADLSSQSEGKRKFGWAPTTKNKKALFNKIVHYTRRIFQIEDEFGNEIDVLGINMIDDIVLLDEIIAYEEGKNVDRITSFMSCLGFEDYLNANYMSFNPNKIYETRREENRERIKKYSSNSFFRQSSGKFF